MITSLKESNDIHEHYIPYLYIIFYQSFSFVVFDDRCYKLTFHFRLLDHGNADLGHDVGNENVSTVQMSFQKRLDMFQSGKNVAKKNSDKGL